MQRSELVLPPLELEFSDYVAWQQHRLESAASEEHWRFWQQQLAGEQPVLHLPTDRPAPPPAR